MTTWGTDLLDDFSTDTIGASKYTFDAGSGTVSVTSGELAFTTAATEKLFYRNDRTARADFRLTSKRRRPAGALTTASHGLCARRIDASNYILIQQSGGTLQILKKDGGSFSTLTSNVTVTADSSSTSYWLRATFDGNTLTGERFTTDPNLGGSATDTITATLAGADATKFGAVSGNPGMRWGLATATDTFGDDFRIEVPATVYTDSASGTLSLSGSSTLSRSATDAPHTGGRIFQDDWSSDDLASYLFDEGSSTGLGVAGGYLVRTSGIPGGAGIFTASAGRETQQTTIAFQWVSANTASCGGVIKRISANNFLMGQVSGPPSAPLIQLYTRVAGSYSNKTNVSIPAKSQNTTYWWRTSISGNVVTGEFFTSDPYAGATAAHTTTYTLTGTDATSFGTGVSGCGGFRFGVSAGADAKLDFVYFETTGDVVLSGTASESIVHGGNTFSDAPAGTLTLAGTKTGSNSGNETPVGTLTLLPTARAQTTGWLSRFDGPIDRFTGPATYHPLGTLTLSGTATDSYVFGGPIVRLTVAVSDSPVTNLSISDAGVTSLVLSDAAV